jgi:FKBP-type peptidyl-prolyl cis-trans isomerase (trigger factor)
MTREEIEKRMDELAREYHETRDPEIPAEIFRLARQLSEMEH